MRATTTPPNACFCLPSPRAFRMASPAGRARDLWRDVSFICCKHKEHSIRYPLGVTEIQYLVNTKKIKECQRLLNID